MLDDLEAAAIEAEQNVVIANEKNVKFGGENEILMKQKDDLLSALESSKGGAMEFFEKEAKLLALKKSVESAYADQLARLEKEKLAKDDLYKLVKKKEADIDFLKNDVQDVEGRIAQAQAEVAAK